jgi:M6 family metalloprotease-like protein
MDVLQPDGKTVTVVLKGNMNHHWTETADGYTVVTVNNALQYATKVGNDLVGTGILAHNPQDRLASEMAIVNAISKSLQPVIQNIKNGPLNYTPTSNKTFPSTGTINVLAILIEYPDLPSTYPKADLDSLLISPNHRNGDGSFKSYYAQSSFGQLTINVDVMGWYMAQNGHKYYSDSAGDPRAAKLAREAVDAAELGGANFANYDNDNDGSVDGILVVHAGPGAEATALNRDRYVWSHRWVMSAGSSVPGGGSVTYDGKMINDYMINPETRGSLAVPRLVGIGVFAHEFGHNLGLPDLYDTDPSNGDSEGIGNWGLMAGGTWLGGEHRPGGFCAWAKEELGWITPTVLASNATGTFSINPASTTQNDVYKITTSNPSEYFLLENRQKVGRDLELPGHGLAIWHINTSRTSNRDETNKLVDLEEADGLNGLDNETNRGDGGDLHPGTSNNADFNDSSNPNSKLQNNTSSGLIVRNIAESGTTVTFDLGAASSAATCTGLTTFTAATGSFDDGSGFLANYDDNQDCSWLIQPTGATSITLSFLPGFFATQSPGDSVTIYDGASAAAPRIASYSGNMNPPAFTSTGGSLFITFKTDGATNAAGWHANYTTTSNLPSCSGLTTLTALNAVFDDGSGANNYTNNLACEWLIQPVGATAITANFQGIFATQANSDVIKIYNGTSNLGTLLGTYSGTTRPPNTITANSGSMFVEFITDGSVVDQGWTLNYSSLVGPPKSCTGTTNLTGNTGSFTDGSAQFSNYSDNLDCSWLIQPTNGQNIQLTFNRFNTVNNTDEVKVYDGPTTASPLLRTISGFQTSIPAINSTGNTLLVKFTTNNNTTRQGWAADYITVAPPATCGGQSTLTAPSGTVTDGSSTFGFYSNNLNCSWLIQPIGATSVTATFTRIATQLSTDLVKIYDGTNSSAPLLGTYSGIVLPAAVTGNSGSLYIEFNTDASIVNAGWSLDYTSIGSTAFCGGTTNLTANSGSFSDGSGSSSYNNNTDCSWLIQPTNGQNVRLDFDAFKTQNNTDFVRIYDGTTTAAPLIGVALSGSTLPATVNSSGNAMLVKFTSNATGTDDGWDARYTTFISTTTCSGLTNLTANSGTFTDGSATTANYSNNLNCSWLIQPSSGANTITVNFNRFNTQFNADQVVVYDGPNNSSPILGTYSGFATPPSVTSTGGSVFVEFNTDANFNLQGWEISYTSTTGGGATFCNGTTNLTTNTGTFSDGSGTQNYGDNSNCQWLIQPANGQPIELTFSNFATEQGWDVVRVYNGATTGATLLGAFSGTTNPGVITSSGGAMLVTFISDISVNDAGWDASYRTIGGGFCTGTQTLTANSGTFTDGSGNQNYGDNADCNWLIQPTSGAQPITLNFTAFATETTNDFVEVFDGSTSAAPSLGVFSGSSLPPSVTSTGGSMLVHFSSDNNTISGTGWNANYTTPTPSGIVMNPDTVFLTANAGANGVFSIVTTSTWTITDNATWLVVANVNGSGNQSSNVLALSANTGATRLGKVLCTAPNGDYDSLIVVQAGGTASTLSVSPRNMTLNAPANSNAPANVTSNTIWTATPSAGWLTVTPSFGMSNATVTIEANTANTGAARSEFVVFTDVSNTLFDTVFVTQSAVGPYIDFQPGPISMAFTNGSTNNVLLSSNVNWTISNTASWLGVSPLSGSNMSSLTLTSLSANTTGAPRSTWIYATDGTVKDSVEIIQLDGISPNLSLSKSIITLAPPSGSNDFFDVTSNVSWSFSGVPAWLTMNPTTGSNNATISVTANSVNNTGLTRTATVTASSTTPGITPQDIVINQIDGSSPYLSASVDTIVLAQLQGSTNAFDVFANVSWTIQENMTWLLMGPKTGTNDARITIQAGSANLSTSTRSGDLTISSAGLPSKIVHVVQLGTMPNLDVSKTIVRLAGDSASMNNFSVLGNSTNWTISGASNWLSVTPSTGSYTAQITLKALTANTGAPRSDTLYVSAAGSVTKTVIVTQDSLQTIGVREISIAEGMKVYPNPTMGVVNIEVDRNMNINDYNVRVTNIMGASINADIQSLSSSKISLDLTGMVSGIYFVIIENGKDRVVKRVSLLESF